MDGHGSARRTERKYSGLVSLRLHATSNVCLDAHGLSLPHDRCAINTMLRASPCLRSRAKWCGDHVMDNIFYGR